MDRYVLSDAQWAKMQPHCLGKKSDPGRSGEDNRRFVEAVLWVARTGSPWRDLPPLFGPWNTVFKRYRDWVKADVSNGFSMRPRSNRTWSTPWSTPPSSRSTAMDKAQKGDSEPGHRQVQGRHDDQNPGPHRCPGQSRPIRAAAGTALRHDGGRAVDRRHRVRRLDRRQGLRCQLDHRRDEYSRRRHRHLAAAEPAEPHSDRPGTLQMASSIPSESQQTLVS